MVVFVQPTYEHILALREFYKAFGPHSIHGGCGLHKCRTVESWLNGEDREDGDSLVFILYDTMQDRVYAIARLTPNPDEELLRVHGYNFGFSVHPEYRRHGYGSLILYKSVREAAKLGMSEVLMAAKIDNVASWRCMERLGGVRVREEDGCYVYSLCNSSATKSRGESHGTV